MFWLKWTWGEAQLWFRDNRNGVLNVAKTLSPSHLCFIWMWLSFRLALSPYWEMCWHSSPHMAHICHKRGTEVHFLCPNIPGNGSDQPRVSQKPSSRPAPWARVVGLPRLAQMEPRLLPEPVSGGQGDRRWGTWQLPWLVELKHPPEGSYDSRIRAMWFLR